MQRTSPVWFCFASLIVCKMAIYKAAIQQKMPLSWVFCRLMTIPNSQMLKHCILNISYMSLLQLWYYATYSYVSYNTSENVSFMIFLHITNDPQWKLISYTALRTVSWQIFSLKRLSLMFKNIPISFQHVNNHT